MKLDILRHGFRIVPEDRSALGDERDLAYIEEVLGLRKEGDSITLIRRNVFGLSGLAYLETVKWSETQKIKVDEDKYLSIKVDPECPNKEPVCPPAISGDVGLDLRLWVDNKHGKVNIPPHSMMNIRTGASVKLPDGYWGDVRPRSSTFAKRQLFVMHGVIDPFYVGPLSVFVYNPTTEGHEVRTGDRLAQLVILPKCVFPLKYVDELPITERNEAGFGSTGP